MINSIKDKSSRAESRSSTQQEEQIVLPCDIFRNMFTHFVWVLTRRTLYKVSVILLFTSLYVVICQVNDILTAISGCILIFDSLFVILFTLFCGFGDSIFQKFSLGDKMVFCGEIVRYRPCSDPATWNIIAFHMNQHFAKERKYLALYNGEDYFRMFQMMREPNENIGRNGNRNKTDNSALNFDNDNNKDNNAMNTATNEVSDDGLTIERIRDTIKSVLIEITDEKKKDNNTNDYDNPKLLYLNKAKRKAQLAFREAENEYWSQIYPELSA